MRTFKRFGPPILLILVLLLPLVNPDPGTYSIIIYTLLFTTAVTGWNIFSGYTGYVSLGYASFTGLGGYTMAIICDHWQIPGGYIPFLLLPVAGLVASIFAIPIGWIALRTRRVTFVVVTIAIMFVLQALAFNLSGFTSGSSGILFPASIWDGYTYNIPYYYVAVLLLVLAIAASWWIRNSKYGLGLLAIRDDEERAQGLGVQTGRFKLMAFVISAFFGGMVGGMLAYYGGSMFPEQAFDPLINLSVALMAFLGGTGTLIGPIVGALILEPLQQSLGFILQGILPLASQSSGLRLIILGSLLLFIILVLPDGIMPTVQRRWNRWMALRRGIKPLASIIDLNKRDHDGGPPASSRSETTTRPAETRLAEEGTD